MVCSYLDEVQQTLPRCNYCYALWFDVAIEAFSISENNKSIMST